MLVGTHGGQSVVYGQKQRALDLISTLRSDVKQADWKSKFLTFENVRARCSRVLLTPKI